MNNLFDPKLVPEEQRGGQPKQERQLGNVSGLSLTTSAGDAFQHEAMSSMHDTPMVGGDSIDDIIRDNSDELSRRRSLPQPFSGSAMQDGSNKGGVPMMGFRSGADLQYGGAGDDAAAFAAAFSQPGMLPMTEAGDFSPLSPEVMGSMMAFSNLNVGPLSSDTASMGMFGGSGLESHFPGGANPLDVGPADFTMGINPDTVSLGAAGSGPGATLSLTGEDQEMMNVAPDFASPHGTRRPQQQRVGGMTPLQPQMPLGLDSRDSPTVATGFGSSPISPSSNSASQPPSTVAPAMAGPIGPAAPPGLPKGKTIYSKSGFNMIRALYYVATRPDASVLLGAVDMSCAFVVCDVTQNDCPIIYVSDNFQNLTGYSSYEIMGKNCRFLQAPDGKVEAGSRRDFVENHAVYRLKRKIAEGKEVQQSLINYRKGGKPFLNLLTMVPIPWDDDLTQIHYFVGFQIDLVESPDAVVSREMGGGVQVNYKHSELPQYIWTPPSSSQWEADNGKTLAKDDVSTLLKQYNPSGGMSDWHKQSWDKMLLENADDVVHVLSLKGMFLYLSPSCKKVLEYDTADLVGNMLSSVCHPSDIVPVTRELKDTQPGNPVNILFRIRRKRSGYTWFESHGSLFVEQGKGRKSIILVGRKRPVFALQRSSLEAHGGIGDSELWTKLSTSGMFLYVSSNVRSLLDLQPENLVGTSIQDLMRKESRPEFGRSIEKARRGKIVSCKHEVQNRRGQVLQAQTLLYPGDTVEGQKPTFLLAQTKLLKASSRILAPAGPGGKAGAAADDGAAPIPSGASGGGGGGGAGDTPGTGLMLSGQTAPGSGGGGGGGLPRGQDGTVAADDNMFEELKTTRCTSWQYELRQMEKMNRMLAEELGQLLSSKKKRKRRKGVGNVVRDCANCHTRNTPEWRRGPSGQRDLCNSCGLRWAKQTGRVSPRNSSRGGNGDTQSKKSNSPIHSSPLQREVAGDGEAELTPVGDGASSQGAAAAAATAADQDPAAKGPSQPPQSHPLLAGGSGVGGASMGMTSIREERETSA